MPYRFDPGHAPGREVARVAREEFGSAIEQLRVHTRRDQPTAVHEARKSVKKLRALLRLTAPHLEPERFRASNQKLRDIGRTLSLLRDAQAMRDAAEELLKNNHLDAETTAVVRERLQLAATNARRRIRIPAGFQRAASALADLQRAQWNAIALPEDDWHVLKAGLKKTYKRGKRAMIRAEREQDAESFHEWRKRVKDHWYHVRLLEAFGNHDWDDRRSDLKKLESLLGDDHNLVMIRETIGDRDKEVKPFLKVLKERSHELRSEALQLGDRLYADSWSDVAETLRARKRVAVA